MTVAVYTTSTFVHSAARVSYAVVRPARRPHDLLRSGTVDSKRQPRARRPHRLAILITRQPVLPLFGRWPVNTWLRIGLVRGTQEGAPRCCCCSFPSSTARLPGDVAAACLVRCLASAR